MPDATIPPPSAATTPAQAAGALPAPRLRVPAASRWLGRFAAGAGLVSLVACSAPIMRTTGEQEFRTHGNQPSSAGTDDLTASSQPKTIDGVTVSARLLPDDEARARYGVDLAGKGIQAVWIQAANRTTVEQWFLASNLDPDYFTADEAAHLYRRHWGGLGFSDLQQQFRDLSMRARLAPGKVYAGHVLIPRTEGGRYIQVTLNAFGRERRFGFPLVTPDGHFDFETMKPPVAFGESALPDLSRTRLRTQLERLPPAVTNAKGTASGDPLNLVLVGNAPVMMAALSECGWSFTHRIDGTTVRRMIDSALEGRPYLTAPVSSVFVFGRKQDVAFQRARPKLSQRNHLRLWRAPYTVDGQSVWIGQVSRDIGIKLTRKSPSLTTHVIDPLVDEARQFVLESLLHRYSLASFGFIRAAEPAPLGRPRTNLTGDPYITDGLRLVVFLSANPVSTDKVRNLGWDQTRAGPVEFGQSVDTGKSLD